MSLQNWELESAFSILKGICLVQVIERYLGLHNAVLLQNLWEVFHFGVSWKHSNFWIRNIFPLSGNVHIYVLHGFKISLSWPHQNEIRIMLPPSCICDLITQSPVWCPLKSLRVCTWNQKFISRLHLYILGPNDSDDLDTVCELRKMLLLLRAAMQFLFGLSSLYGLVCSKASVIQQKPFDEHQLNWKYRSSLMNQFWKF